MRVQRRLEFVAPVIGEEAEEDGDGLGEGEGLEVGVGVGTGDGAGAGDGFGEGAGVGVGEGLGEGDAELELLDEDFVPAEVAWVLIPELQLLKKSSTRPDTHKIAILCLIFIRISADAETFDSAKDFYKKTNRIGCIFSAAPR